MHPFLKFLLAAVVVVGGVPVLVAGYGVIALWNSNRLHRAEASLADEMNDAYYAYGAARVYGLEMRVDYGGKEHRARTEIVCAPKSIAWPFSIKEYRGTRDGTDEAGDWTNVEAFVRAPLRHFTKGGVEVGVRLSPDCARVEGATKSGLPAPLRYPLAREYYVRRVAPIRVECRLDTSRYSKATGRVPYLKPIDAGNVRFHSPRVISRKEVPLRETLTRTEYGGPVIIPYLSRPLPDYSWQRDVLMLRDPRDGVWHSAGEPASTDQTLCDIP